MSTPNDDETDMVGAVLNELEQWRIAQEEGGPKVDYRLLYRYLDPTLDITEEERRNVLQNVEKWKPWFNAFFQLKLELDLDLAIADAKSYPNTVERPARERCPDSHGVEIDSQDTSGRHDDAREVQTSQLAGVPSRGRRVGRRTWLALAASLLIAVAITSYWWHEHSKGHDIAFVDQRNEVKLDGEVLHGFDAYPAKWQAEAKRLLVEKQYERSRTVEVLTQDLQSKSPPPNKDPYSAFITPVNTGIRSDQPTLRWKPRTEGAGEYDVAVYDRDGEFVDGTTLPATEWKISKPLSRGIIYAWRVIAIKDGTRYPALLDDVPYPKFLVLDQATLESVQRRKKEISDSHLLLSLLYAEAGLLDDATAELEALLEANPGSSELSSLMNSLWQLRRSNERATGEND